MTSFRMRTQAENPFDLLRQDIKILKKAIGNQ